ncbi:MAG: hypothetical protein ABFD50_14030 [Smithella sp.]
MKKRIVGFLVGLSVLLMSGIAAYSYNFELSIPNTGISDYTGPYAHVDISLNNSQEAVVTVTTYTGFLIGTENAFGLNTNGAVTVSNLAWSGDASGNAHFESSSPGQLDGFGNFNFVLSNFDGYTSAVSSLTFTLTSTGSGWTEAANVLSAPIGGYLSAAHIFVINPDPNGKALATGFAANPVPVPAAIYLFGSGLAVLGFIPRRKSKK